jgi:hypothetical protein
MRFVYITKRVPLLLDINVKMRHRTAHKSTIFFLGKKFRHIISTPRGDDQSIQDIGGGQNCTNYRLNIVTGFGKISTKVREFKIQQSSASFDQKLKFCIFERCLDSNPESCLSRQARYQLSHPSPLLATHLHS